MFLPFFANLRGAGVPVSLREFLTFLDALRHDLALYDLTGFYHLARAAMVKDERHLDRFDRAFSASFSGLEGVSLADLAARRDLPEDWLRKLAERHFTPEEIAQVQAMGGFDALMKALQQRLADQKARHQGGNKWIGTGGTSPFGAHGYNPEGVRIGQEASRHQRAVKVWDRREFRNLDDSGQLNTRSILVALRRLRAWARDGAEHELDMDGTIRATADQGWLDVRTRPQRRNAVRVLLFLDAGGSMDAHVRLLEQLFSAARSTFGTLRHYYFHNCLYEFVWTDNARRWTERTPTWDVLRALGPMHKCIFVGDAAMSPYEIAVPGGANEHWNDEAGQVWLARAREHWPSAVWINPVPQQDWPRTQSTTMIRQIFDDRMFPLTLDGLTRAMQALGR